MIKNFSALNPFKYKFIRTAQIYTFANILNAAIPFLLIPILTRYLTPADYGIVAMFGVLLNLVAPFTGVNLHGAIARQYYDRDEVDMPLYVSNCLLILFCSTITVGVIFYICAEPLSRISSVPVRWLWAVIIVSAAQFINRVNLTLWQVQVKPIAYGVYQVSQTVIILILSIWFVVDLGMNWQGRVQAQVIGFATYAVLGLYILKREGWIKSGIDKAYIKNALNFGVPLIPHSLGSIVKTIIDRIMITSMISVAATGLYSVGFQVGMIIGILEGAFNLAYTPWLFERLKQNRYSDKIRIVKLTYVYFVVIISMAVGLGLIAPWFLTFFVGPKFLGSGQFVFWIAMGFAFNGMYKMVVNYIYYERKTYILAWITISMALISIVANYFAIKYLGAIGAAYTYAGMSFVTFFVVWYASARVYKMPWLLLWGEK